MKKNIFILTLILIIGAFAFISFNHKSEESSVPSANTQAVAPTASSTSTTKNYTIKDVASHKDSASCWTIINGKVYDVTSWINQHPGGPEAILSICGADGSAAFNDQHGGQNRPQNELQAFLIGTLTQ